MWRADCDAASRAQRTAFGCTDGEVVPADVELGALQSEELDDAAEFESAEPVVSDSGDEVGARHGVMLPEADDCASDAC